MGPFQPCTTRFARFECQPHELTVGLVSAKGGTLPTLHNKVRKVRVPTSRTYSGPCWCEGWDPSNLAQRGSQGSSANLANLSLHACRFRGGYIDDSSNLAYLCPSRFASRCASTCMILANLASAMFSLLWLIETIGRVRTWQAC